MQSLREARPIMQQELLGPNPAQNNLAFALGFIGFAYIIAHSSLLCFLVSSSPLSHGARQFLPQL